MLFFLYEENKKMDTVKQVAWNSVAPVADQGGSVIPGTGIKAGQEVIYSKIIRKMMVRPEELDGAGHIQSGHRRD